MDTDDLEPITRKPKKKDLTLMSIADLRDYIDELKLEVARAEGAIATKGSARHGAEGFFKK